MVVFYLPMMVFFRLLLYVAAGALTMLAASRVALMLLKVPSRNCIIITISLLNIYNTELCFLAATIMPVELHHLVEFLLC